MRYLLAWGLGMVLTGLAQAQVQIVVGENPPRIEQLAAREVCRYFYLRTGTLAPIVNAGARDSDWIVIGQEKGLNPQEYRLRTVVIDGHRQLRITGGDETGVLYGAYRLAEHLGVAFALDGDVVPDARIAPSLPMLEEKGTPLFELRGIQPFHDFPEGPDWWSEDDYKAVISQLPKLKMNFIGLHTYPQGGVGPEPAVWIGRPEDVGEGSQVRASYPASWANTLRGMWGYEPKKTSAYVFGAAQLFDADAFGPAVMAGMMPRPSTDAQCNELFDRSGALLHNAFSHARRLGVKTCIGTETPLIVPDAVRQRLGNAPNGPITPAQRKQLYEGIFRRIAQTDPVDYYWLWTPEDWTWRGASPEQVAATIDDLKMAGEAAQAVGARFQLATCGWVLGPPSNRALFDQTLPKDWPVSCINRAVGKDPVEPGFQQVKGRGKWAIPWMEDDPNLTSPQLWAGRMRRDAADARRYGCTGLMGIHWRTRVIGPNVMALAQAAWQQDGWEGPADARNAPTGDFYRAWARVEFGPEAADEIAAIFQRIDGHLPEPAKWTNGPGGIAPDAAPWSKVATTYAFVDDLASLRGRVRGRGNQARFDYWLESFRSMRCVEKLKAVWAEFDAAMKKVAAAPDATGRARLAESEAVAMRVRLVEATSEVYEHLLATVGTRGELGTVCNWESHILPGLLDGPGRQLSRALGHELGSAAMPARSYSGPARLIVPTVRTSLDAGEPLRIEALVLSQQRGAAPILHWRKLGQGGYARASFEHVARGVYRAQVPGLDSGTIAIEYFIDVVADGQRLVFPATAPDLNQSVVIAP